MARFSDKRLDETREEPSNYYLSLLHEALRDVKKGRRFPRVPQGRTRFKPLKEHLFHEYPEFFFQIGGANRFQFPEDRFTLKGGEMCLMPAGVPHKETFMSSRTRFNIVVITFTQNAVTWHSCEFPREQPIPRMYAFCEFPCSEISAITSSLNECARVSRFDTPMAGESSRAFLTVAMSMLIDVLQSSNQDVRHTNPKIKRCLHQIDNSFSDPDLNVKKLSGFLRCSADYLSNLFHTQTGQQLNHYLSRKRIDFSKSLLENTSLNVSEIARACGYKDSAYFCKCFKAHEGLTPRRYRTQRIEVL